MKAAEALEEVTLGQGSIAGTTALQNPATEEAADVEYSTDGTAWTDLAKGATSDDISVNAGDIIKVRVTIVPSAVKEITVNDI